MKRLLAVMIALTFCFTIALAEIDLSGMSFDELIALREQLNLAIWNSEEWEEVNVPTGVWEVGKDIPAGHYTISCRANTIFGFASLVYSSALDSTGMQADIMKTVYAGQIYADGNNLGMPANIIDMNVEDGMYIVIEYSGVVFSPFAGKPDLGFSK